MLGIIWLIRDDFGADEKTVFIAGTLNIYCHAELKQTILTIEKLTIPEKFVKMIGDRILFHPVADGKSREIMGV